MRRRVQLAAWRLRRLVTSYADKHRLSRTLTARFLDLPVHTFCAWLDGLISLPLPTLRHIAEMLGLPEDWYQHCTMQTAFLHSFFDLDSAAELQRAVELDARPYIPALMAVVMGMIQAQCTQAGIPTTLTLNEQQEGVLRTMLPEHEGASLFFRLISNEGIYVRLGIIANEVPLVKTEWQLVNTKSISLLLNNIQKPQYGI